MSDSISTKAVRIAELADTMGIGLHMGGGSYGDALAVDRYLDYVGIENVRLNAPTDQKGQDDILTIGRLGAKLDVVINGYGPVYLSSVVDTVNVFRPYMNAVEGPNEVDIFPISYGSLYYIDAAMKFQEDIYAAVRADGRNAGIDVFNFSFGNIPLSEFPQLRDMSPYSDYTNVHTYSNRGLRPAFVNPAAVEGWSKLAPDNPVVITESGYYTIPGHPTWGGVTEGVQAQYLLDAVLGAVRNDVSRIYLYNLIDTSTDPNGTERDGRFGVYNYDGTAKMAADALHNFTTILSDRAADAATFATTDVTYTVTGLPFTGASELFEKSDGTHMIVVWNEEQLWNYEAGREINARDFDTTVHLDRVYDTVMVYDPMLGSAPIATYHNVKSVDMVVSSHPLILELGEPVADAGTQLVLRLSEDAYQGDAQFVVKVDGVQVGGVQTVTALQSAGKTQDFTFTGPWSSGTHKVTVDFLNDAFDPATGADRNIYVHSVLFDGVRHNGGIIYAGPADFTVTGNAANDETPAPVPTPTGPDRLTLRLSEDAYQGDAQFTVKVDGVQVGGTYTVTALESARQTQDITLAGTWAAGAHKVTVDFFNDNWDPSTPGADRNVYVHSIDLNGVKNGGGIIYAGAVDFNVTGGATMANPTPVTTPPTTPPSTPTPTPGGTGQLTLRLSEDAYQGDAQFVVKVDGVQVGDVQTVTALQSAGRTQDFTFTGPWSSGTHKVTVDFLNDAFDPATGADRNIYVHSIDLNGVKSGGGIIYAGAADFTVTGGAAVAEPTPVTTTTTPATVTTTPAVTVAAAGSGPDNLVLRLSETPYVGDVQYLVTVDGVQIGNVRTVTALHAGGESQNVVINGDFGTGSHEVRVNFLNDYANDANTSSRVLYVEDVSFNGASYGSAVYEKGVKTFTVGTGAPHDNSAPRQMVLQMSEDAYQGDAQFTVAVDGVQMGGVRTVTASRLAGHDQDVVLNGNWTPGEHKVTVNFLNDLAGSGPGEDRNLHVETIFFDGKAYTDTTRPLNAGGASDFFVGGDRLTLGASTELVLHMSEYAWNGDAQFVVKVDGVQASGARTVTASHTAGHSQEFKFTGNWDAGEHRITIDYINEASGGTAATDRNLYVDAIEFGGTRHDIDQTIFAGSADFHLLAA